MLHEDLIPPTFHIVPQCLEVFECVGFNIIPRTGKEHGPIMMNAGDRNEDRLLRVLLDGDGTDDAPEIPGRPCVESQERKSGFLFSDLCCSYLNKW
jgi:hypothetical protein